MARLFTTGFETGAAEWNGATNLTSTDFRTDYKRTGDYSIRLTMGSSVGGSGSSLSYFRQVFDDNTTTLFGRLAVRVSSILSLYTFRMVSFRDANNAIMFDLAYNGGTQTMYWRDGGGTTLGVGFVLVPADTWVVCEFGVVVDGASGSLTLKINGTTDAVFSGDTDYTGEGNVRSLYFHPLSTFNGVLSSFLYLDDIAINDDYGSYENSWIGLGGTFWLEPTADGTTNDWTPSTGSDNYATVDEVPPNTTDYVQALDAASLDLYAVEDCPDYVDRVRLVQVMYRAALVTSGENDLRDVIRVDGTNYEGDPFTVVPLIPSFTLYKGETHYINPDTSAEWLVAEVDALEAGFEIVA